MISKRPERRVSNGPNFAFLAMLFIFRNEFNGDYNFRMVLETQVIFLPSSDVLDKQFEVQLFSPNIFSQLDNN